MQSYLRTIMVNINKVNNITAIKAGSTFSVVMFYSLILFLNMIILLGDNHHVFLDVVFNE